MKRYHILTGGLFSTLVSFSLLGCGGSTSTDQTILEPTAKVSGTVPGTLIEVFCEDGSYYSTTSVQNGTDQHPFEIEVPLNTDCRIVMTTNENDPDNKVVTPIGIVTADGNSTLFRAEGDIDLGYVDLAMDRDLIIDIEGDGVSDKALEIEVEHGLLTVELENDPMDKDGDGLLNVYDNDDNDTLCNHDDDDDDNDGIVDDEDTDDDGDGIEDNDTDGDGVTNNHDVDDDNDGLHDDDDDDDDNDGINDDDDDDDDNDGIADEEDDD